MKTNSFLKKCRYPFFIAAGLSLYCIILAHVPSRQLANAAADPVHEAGGDFVCFKYNGIDLDFCPLCLGVWFDEGELSRIGERPGVPSRAFATILPKKQVMEEVRQCPVCREGMLKKAIARHPRLVIDVCPNGDGLWVEGVEIDLIDSELLRELKRRCGYEDDELTLALNKL